MSKDGFSNLEEHEEITWLVRGWNIEEMEVDIPEESVKEIEDLIYSNLSKKIGVKDSGE